MGKRGQERGQHSVYDVKETISHISDESYAPERSCFCEIYASMYVAQLFRMVLAILRLFTIVILEDFMINRLFFNLKV